MSAPDKKVLWSINVDNGFTAMGSYLGYEYRVKSKLFNTRFIALTFQRGDKTWVAIGDEFYGSAREAKEACEEHLASELSKDEPKIEIEWQDVGTPSINAATGKFAGELSFRFTIQRTMLQDRFNVVYMKETAFHPVKNYFASIDEAKVACKKIVKQEIREEIGKNIKRIRALRAQLGLTKPIG